MTRDPDYQSYTFFLTACELHIKKTRKSTRELHLLRQYLLEKILSFGKVNKINSFGKENKIHLGLNLGFLFLLANYAFTL
jgi:hypothetical protein